VLDLIQGGKEGLQAPASDQKAGNRGIRDNNDGKQRGRGQDTAERLSDLEVDVPIQKNLTGAIQPIAFNRTPCTDTSGAETRSEDAWRTGTVPRERRMMMGWTSKCSPKRRGSCAWRKATG